MARLREAAARWERDALVQACLAADVPAGPVNAVDQVLADPHVRARGMVDGFDHPTVGRFPALPLPFKFAGFDQPALGRPPLLGEHTDALLGEVGFAADAIARLRAEKVVS
jgi:crotonobetainyl-CoA:carnitine CoA-transferase CaiB-like acyl-CoA transferase